MTHKDGCLDHGMCDDQQADTLQQQLVIHSYQRILNYE